jgi:hypothetical protein
VFALRAENRAMSETSAAKLAAAPHNWPSEDSEFYNEGKTRTPSEFF